MALNLYNKEDIRTNYIDEENDKKTIQEEIKERAEKKSLEIVDGINSFNNKLGAKNKELNEFNIKMIKFSIEKCRKNIDEWAHIREKIPFLKGLCNLMLKINNKQLHKHLKKLDKLNEKLGGR